MHPGAKPGAVPNFAGWSVPVNLGPVVNSSVAENGPALSKDGLSLYFGSARAGGSGAVDLWVSTRASVDASWQLPVNLGAVVNSAAIDNVPVLSRDEHWLFFNWQAPVNLGPPVNSDRDDHGLSGGGA